jgi:antitoxin component YwqK of YwqJK toxin-antitoxin module
MSNKKIEIRRVNSPDGSTRYVKDGKLHNSAGPALIHPDGKEEYYLNGFLYSKDEYKKRKKEGEGLPFYKTSSGKMRH